MRPTGGAPGVKQKSRCNPICIAPNGCPPTTLPEPIKRARNWDTNGFAGEGNVAERSERYASEEKPDESRSLSRIKPVQTRSVGGLVICRMAWWLKPERRASTTITPRDYGEGLAQTSLPAGLSVLFRGNAFLSLRSPGSRRANVFVCAKPDGSPARG
jgi:hypothetical protein